MKKYAETHEYVSVDGKIATVGISVDAADELGDLAQIELPEVGTAFQKGDVFSNVESAKATQELLAPVSGTIVEVNTALTDTPELVNDDAEGAGWIVKIEMSDVAELDDLFDEDPAA
jgi:glycine cleavage system H protein